MTRPFEIRGRLRSFTFAFAGVWTMLKTQHSAWIHTVATLVVIAGGIFFSLSTAEWCWVTLAIMAVWSAEALNTAFEFLADVVSPEFHPLVKHSKDVAAGAVLISVIGSCIIGALIFGPHIIRWME